jgi:dTDP-4-amino-4,6-dideoxygalactose transaminase
VPNHLSAPSPFWSAILGRAATHLPVTKAVADRTLALPFFNRITNDQIQRVAAELQISLPAL